MGLASWSISFSKGPGQAFEDRSSKVADGMDPADEGPWRSSDDVASCPNATCYDTRGLLDAISNDTWSGLKPERSLAFSYCSSSIVAEGQ